MFKILSLAILQFDPLYLVPVCLFACLSVYNTEGREARTTTKHQWQFDPIYLVPVCLSVPLCLP